MAKNRDFQRYKFIRIYSVLSILTGGVHYA